MERKLIAALMERPAYERIRSKINPSTDLSPEAQVILSAIDSFFSNDANASRADRDILVARISRTLSNPEHVAQFTDLVLGLPTDVSQINVTEEWLAQKRDIAVNKLRTALITPGDTDLIATAIEEYKEYDTETEENQQAYDVVSVIDPKDIEAKTDAAHRMPLLPTAFNGSIGNGAFPGHLIFVYARPEIGKSAFGINLLRQPAASGRPCLYIGNEDPIREAIIPRAIESFAGMDRKSQSWSELHIRACENGLGNVRFVAAFPGTVGDISDLVAKYKPELLVIDQVGNLAVKDDSYTLQLGKIMRGLRTVTKKNNLVTVAFHQAGDSASNKLNLDMGDVSWSNTDMAAQADLMVGIGCDDNYMVRNLRRLNVVKNKINGWHGFVDVEIIPQLSRYKSI